MTTATQTLNTAMFEMSANQEPDLCDETKQGEDPSPPKKEERPDRTEDTDGVYQAI